MLITRSDFAVEHIFFCAFVIKLHDLGKGDEISIFFNCHFNIFTYTHRLTLLNTLHTLHYIHCITSLS